MEFKRLGTPALDYTVHCTMTKHFKTHHFVDFIFVDFNRLLLCLSSVLHHCWRFIIDCFDRFERNFAFLPENLSFRLPFWPRFLYFVQNLSYLSYFFFSYPKSFFFICSLIVNMKQSSLFFKTLFLTLFRITDRLRSEVCNFKISYLASELKKLPIQHKRAGSQCRIESPEL